MLEPIHAKNIKFSINLILNQKEPIPKEMLDGIDQKLRPDLRSRGLLYYNKYLSAIFVRLCVEQFNMTRRSALYI